MEENINGSSINIGRLSGDSHGSSVPEPPRIVSNGWNRRVIAKNAALLLAIAVIFATIVLGAFTLTFLVAEAIFDHEWGYVVIFPTVLVIGYATLFISLAKFNRGRNPGPKS
jgi:hypothetical protein